MQVYVHLMDAWRDCAMIKCLSSTEKKKISVVVALLFPVSYSVACMHSVNMLESLVSICADLYTPLSPKVSWYIQSNGEWKQKDEEGSNPNFITVLRQDYFK